MAPTWQWPWTRYCSWATRAVDIEQNDVPIAIEETSTDHRGRDAMDGFYYELLSLIVCDENKKLAYLFVQINV